MKWLNKLKKTPAEKRQIATKKLQTLKKKSKTAIFSTVTRFSRGYYPIYSISPYYIFPLRCRLVFYQSGTLCIEEKRNYLKSMSVGNILSLNKVEFFSIEPDLPIWKKHFYIVDVYFSFFSCALQYVRKTLSSIKWTDWNF